MQAIIEFVVNLLSLYIIGVLIGLISFIFVIPITKIVGLIEKRIRKEDEFLQIYNVFRFDHFLNYFIIGFMTIAATSFLLEILPWKFSLRVIPIIFYALFDISTYNPENGIQYEFSIIGGRILGLIIGYATFS